MEEALRHRLWQGIVASILIALTIVIAGFSIVSLLRSSLRDLTHEQMKTETLADCKRILQQIDKDFQTLDSMAALLEAAALTEDPDFSLHLLHANSNNSFETLGYFSMNGIGFMTNLDYGIQQNVNYMTLNPAVQEAMNVAYTGNPAISKLFPSDFQDKFLFAYCMPIYRDGHQIGQIIASDHLDIFNEVLPSDSIMSGDGALYLLDSAGTLLLPNAYSRAKTNLFTVDHFRAKDLEKVLAATAAGESIYSTLTIENYTLDFYLHPVGVHDWYLLLAYNPTAATSTMSSMVHTMGIVFLLLSTLVILLLVFIVRMIRRNNERLTELAFRDRLTGADNHLRFSQQLEKARVRDGDFCLVALNIRQFKFINEIFGSTAADELLCKIYRTICACLFDGEFCCRDSADLFYLYLRQNQESTIRARVERLINRVSEQTLSGPRDYQVQLYAGAYIHSESVDASLSTEMMFTRTLFAMQHCKTAPGMLLHFYDADVHKGEEVENYVETHMHQALERGEFRMYLQPKFNLETQQLGGAEALVRWIADDGTTIYPGVFIPQFERNGFCVQLDLYMVEQVFRQLRAWMDAGIEPIPVSVNQSKLLFFESSYLSRLQEMLARYQVPAHWITLEILEGLALEHAAEINEKLQRLRDMGFRISMDDFGSGYASFNTLGNLEIDELKLDRSFLMEASQGHSSRFRLIIASIIKLSKSLHISTVAEGVETQEDEDMIRMLGCDFGQGYLYDRPLSAQDFHEKYMLQRLVP